MFGSRLIFGLAAAAMSVMMVSPSIADDIFNDLAKWPVYDPQPGHPTADEAKVFVEKLRPVATEAQKKYGIPRAGILAMAVQESGYGWTRTGIYARNAFGWKYGQSAKDAHLKSWRLDGQPASDPGNLYAAFSSHEDSMRFVASQLAAGRYRDATDASRDSIKNNSSERERTLAWLEAIQKAGYNPNKGYPAQVMKAGDAAGVFNGWVAAADTAENVKTTATNGSVFDQADRDKVQSWLQKDDTGRYMIHGATCSSDKQADWPGYETLPNGALQRCRYSVTSCVGLKSPANRLMCEQHRTVTGTKSATVVLLEPGLQRFATWVASACAVAGGNRQKCLERIYNEGVGASNWQIPVSGIVYEDLEPNFVQYGYAFRDGMTVRADAACGWQNGSKGEAAPGLTQDAACSRAQADPQGVSNKVRPMSTTLTDLRTWRPNIVASLPNHSEAYPIQGAAAVAWRSFVQKR